MKKYQHLPELHLTKDDFEITWFSGTGAGGQHRNRTRNCCRIRHKETGISAQGTEHKDRKGNQRAAFKRVAKRLLDHLEKKHRAERELCTSDEVIRTYNESRNNVVDKASGHRDMYKNVVIQGNMDEMIEARRTAKIYEGSKEK